RQNDGFRILSGLLKDALMFRLGGVTVDLEEVNEARTLPVRGLPKDAVDLLVAELAHEGASVALDLTPEVAPEPVVRVALAEEVLLPPALPRDDRLSGAALVTQVRLKVVVEAIAPEDLRFSPSARHEDKASFLGYVKRATASDLAKLGVSEEEIAVL